MKTPSFIPDDPKKLRAKIRSYERALAKEKATHGMHSDGHGKRYLLGPLYLFQGDMEAALRHFEWYETEFPDDSHEPGQLLCWTLVLHRAGKEDSAEMKLGETMLANVHMIPHLLGEKTIQPCPPDYMTQDSSEWVGTMPPEYFEIWTNAEMAWAKDLHNGPYFFRIRHQWMELDRLLEEEKPGPERTRMCKEKRALVDKFRAGC